MEPRAYPEFQDILGQRRSPLRNCIAVGLVSAISCFASAAQTSSSAPNSSSTTPNSPGSSSTPSASETTWHPSTEDLLPEVQKNVGRNGRVAFLWWMPAEYFETKQTASSPGYFAGFRNNTVVAVAFGKVQPFGILDFVPLDAVRSSVTMRDANGKEYKPLEKIPEDVRVPLEMMKPVFSASLGKLGENIQFLVFAGKTRNGTRIADPRGQGEFSMLVKELTGEPETAVTWRLPLSGMFPPRYCPVGKERVEASWKFCPWHGVSLSQSPVK